HAEAAGAGTSAIPPLAAGSVGPYGAALGDGAEYTGNYQLSTEEYTAFHRPRIEPLAEAEADLLAIETQPRLEELQAIVSLAAASGLATWVGVPLRAGTDTSPDAAIPTLPAGSSLAELAQVVTASASVRAVGVNCVRPSLVTPALEGLAAH